VLDQKLIRENPTSVEESLSLRGKVFNISHIHKLTIEKKEIDIDRVDLYKDKYKKYDYEVPGIAVERISSEEIIELPRISPRLKDDQLKNWFQKNISTILEKLFFI